ncbi:MAG TPA: hypothetical protein PKA28_07090 [Methylomusa anaerophila]|uniref:Uncharacterized protein n=1 Tax=Methylomusa anaerophila TaxID=1930071 RepID=A0A348AG75_9FIRM|nr:hypothetical protein [Methylomusa anaerophila]BBB90073.1 hypothetical protein MAMMFC1_00721 [Methylomusa anaerophila]HML88202.1 hypothetical protein [Methylomusa anaerophila]
MSDVNPDTNTVKTIVALSPKNMGLSLMLTFLFGSIGMFYSTVMGAIIMLVVEVVVGIVTFGFGLLVTHPVCMIWGALAVKSYNNKLLSGELRA